MAPNFITTILPRPCPIYQMCTNFSRAEFQRAVPKLWKRKRKLFSCVHVLHKTWNSIPVIHEVIVGAFVPTSLMLSHSDIISILCFLSGMCFILKLCSQGTNKWTVRIISVNCHTRGRRRKRMLTWNGSVGLINIKNNTYLINYFLGLELWKNTWKICEGGQRDP